VLRLTFSEKMDRTSAVSWLHFFPDQRIRKTKWHGAREAEIVLDQPFPADTLVVVEISAAMRDAHRVKSRFGRRFPLATADSIPSGEIVGMLVLGDSAVVNGVVELYDLPPDTLKYFQQPMLRRTATDRAGNFRFSWLPVPGGPWLLRAFADSDADLRPGEREAQRLLPDTLNLALDVPAVSAGVTTLFSRSTPGRLVADPFPPFDWPASIWGFALAIAEDDTGWVPGPLESRNSTLTLLDPATGGTLSEVKAGRNRVVVFADLDADSTFSVIADSTLHGLPDSLVSDTGWWLEPWLLLEELEVEPGLAGSFTIPRAPLSLIPFAAPPIDSTVVDSLAVNPGAMPDSLVLPERLDTTEPDQEDR
jgi:hypothetical protein